MIGWKYSPFMRPSGVGSPRYFSSNVELETPKVALMSFWTAVGQTEVNRREHFELLSS
jgi:hypothetical protein